MDNRIKKSIENITPTENAKQRMYQNILRKAQEEKTKLQLKKSPMRVLKVVFPIAACLCIAVTGISHINFFGNSPISSSSEDSDIQTTNPFMKVSSAEEFKKINIEIDAPEGAENISYAIIDGNIAEINFDKNGHNYVLRASEQSGDFSGIYSYEISREPLDSETGAARITQSGIEFDYLKVFWTTGKTNYYLCNTDGGNTDELKEIAHELIK